jgi:hypothetical protein
MSEPSAPPPEDRDWTYVITQGCIECGFTPVHHTLAAARLRATVPRWRAALSEAWATTRPAPLVWSALEYGCHARDVCRVMGGRIELMLAADGSSFANWDQDATAITDRYWAQDPGSVADEYATAAELAAAALDIVSGGAWERRGIRSNGSQFTVATLAVYFLHDVEHHLHDVGA